jgi:hypothetical protein
MPTSEKWPLALASSKKDFFTQLFLLRIMNIPLRFLLKMLDNTEINMAGIWATSVFVARPFASVIWNIRTAIFDLSQSVSSEHLREY